MKFAILLCTFFGLIVTLNREPLKVTWIDLAPHIPFEDLFAELEQDNLLDLRWLPDIVGSSRKAKQLVKPGTGSGFIQKSLDEAGIDVDGLLSLCEEIKEKI